MDDCKSEAMKRSAGKGYKKGITKGDVSKMKREHIRRRVHGTAMWKLGGKSTPPDGK